MVKKSPIKPKLNTIIVRSYKMQPSTIEMFTLTNSESYMSGEADKALSTINTQLLIELTMREKIVDVTLFY